MGYDLHVTRADFWAANEGAWIAPEEWLAVVQRDTELQLIADSEPYSAEWLHEPSGDSVCFVWDEGNVFVKNPTHATIRKIEELASQLRAVVQGDDGEVYKGGEVLEE